MALVDDPSAQVEWERRERPRAAVLALIGALAPIAGAIANGVVYDKAPRAGILDSLSRAFEPGPVGDLTTLREPQFQWYMDNGPLLLAIGALNAVGYLAIGLTLIFLGAATAAREPSFKRWAVHIPLVGALMIAAATLVVVIVTLASISGFVNGSATVASVADVGDSLGARIAYGLEVGGRLLLGLGLALTAFQAMRAGLLTRFIGILGIITGLLLNLPELAGPIPIVQAFWLISLALTISPRLPHATPLAWRTGKAERWPTQLELKEAREAAEERAASEDTGSRKRGGRAGTGAAAGDADAAGQDSSLGARPAAPDAEDAHAAAAVRAAGPRSKRRKRKKRK